MRSDSCFKETSAHYPSCGLKRKETLKTRRKKIDGLGLGFKKVLEKLQHFQGNTITTRYRE